MDLVIVFGIPLVIIWGIFRMISGMKMPTGQELEFALNYFKTNSNPKRKEYQRNWDRLKDEVLPEIIEHSKPKSDVRRMAERVLETMDKGDQKAMLQWLTCLVVAYKSE